MLYLQYDICSHIYLFNKIQSLNFNVPHFRSLMTLSCIFSAGRVIDEVVKSLSVYRPSAHSSLGKVASKYSIDP